MKNEEKSLQYQIKAGTKERNDQIRQQYRVLVEMGIPGALSIVGRKQKPPLSRQRVWQIIHNHN